MCKGGLLGLSAEKSYLFLLVHGQESAQDLSDHTKGSLKNEASSGSKEKCQWSKNFACYLCAEGGDQPSCRKGLWC